MAFQVQQRVVGVPDDDDILAESSRQFVQECDAGLDVRQLDRALSRAGGPRKGG